MKKKAKVTMLYCLAYPDGRLEGSTARTTADDCWMEAFSILCADVKGFEDRYWKKWEESIRAAERLGYEIVPCVLSPLSHKPNKMKGRK